MRISIFGLGYVGAVTGACMAKEGHPVIGVDPDPHKRDLIASGKSPIVEEGLDELMEEGVSSGRLRVTDSAEEGVGESEISLICVGTPSNPNGSLRLDFVERVSCEIGEAIKKKRVAHHPRRGDERSVAGGDERENSPHPSAGEGSGYHSVVVRSTVLPGTTAGLVIPSLESAGIRQGVDFGVSMNPEFLREGVSIFDFYNPPYTVIGTDTEEEFERVKGMYTGVPGDFIHCKLSTAEAIKYGCNIFHALKITFANEMGTLCKSLGVDSTEALDIICKDTKLNISSKYMKPGFAFGGSCLPKDLRGYTYKSRSLDSPLPMFEGALASNRAQIERAAARIAAMGSKKVAMLGISFKEGTDDLRESPLVSLAEILIGKGFDLRIFDPNVEYASLYGSNKEFIDKELPHLKRILVSAEEALASSDTVVFGHNAPVYKELVPKIESRHKVFDLVRIADASAFSGECDGLYW